MKLYSADEAKDRVPEIVEYVVSSHEPAHIHHPEGVVVVISADDLKDLVTTLEAAYGPAKTGKDDQQIRSEQAA